MATQKPIRHIYQVQNPERYKEVKHYLIVEVSNGNRQLPEIANISENRNFSKAKNVDYWLKGKNTNQNKFSKPITGLKPTGQPLIYYGDIPTKKDGRFKPKDLLIFRFSTNAETLTIDLYQDFYTNNPAELHAIIKNH